ncbi:YihY family inner membrane protein [Sphaerotilus sp.]|uniref:YihY family inner membrane protein n=1 Tax=Sphaerotilus sp. TaxID=2093942 RepID=UPI002ACE4FB0|nr:YihY family inner membrane protein [Sphaerotilus sp.]MDZ7858286.1 YihY family inner membrane protein [Sphaerotilus sp.]
MHLFSSRWAAFQAWPWLDTLRTLRQRFREDRLGVTAGSLTFTTMVSLVPLLTVTFALFTAFPMFASFRKALEVYFLQNLVPDAIARPVFKQLTLFASKASQVGAVGLVVLVLTAIALLLTIDRSLNAIWRVRQTRSLAQRVLVYWATATLAPLVLGVSLSLTTSYAVSVSSDLNEALPGGVSLLLGLVELGLMAFGVSALFKFVPNTQVRWSHAALGGVFVAIGFEMAKRGLAWYLGLAPTYTTIYGAFATVPILLSWIYLGWVIVLLGAVIAAYAPSLQMRVVRQAVTPGWRFLFALTLLRELAQARQGPARGVAVVELCERLRLDPLQVEPVLAQLQRLDWVGVLQEPGLARHVLLVDPAHTPVAPLVQALLLSVRSEDEPFWQNTGLSQMRLADALDLRAAPGA